MSLRKATGMCVLVALIAPASAFAQSSMGAVDGTVKDSTGGVVPGAAVTLTNEATNISFVRQTNESGYFIFVNVRPGSYALTVELEGLKTARLASLTVGVSETVTRNVTLEVGPLAETVEVTGQSELLQTSSAGLGNVVPEKMIRQLPMQGRNFTPLFLLTPGVNPVSTAQGAGQNGSNETGVTSIEGNSGIPGGSIFNVSIQGQQNRSKVYYMDGIINTSVRAGTYVALPDIDSLQEFKVQSQSDKAEFGGVLGGVVNLVSKSGGNRFSGAGFGFFRNESFTARNPFRDANASKPPDFSQSQFGVNLGGPLIRDRTFFFASYDGWRYRDFSDIRQTVPTDAQLNGDFSQTYHRRPIYNPYTTRIVNGRTVRDQFPNNIIPPELISPTMQAFLKAYMPKPTVAGNVVDNLRLLREQESNSNSYQFRVDHHFSPADSLFFRWTERRISAFVPRGDLGYQEPDSINRNFGGGWFHSFSPNLILEVRGGVATQPTEDAPYQHPLGFDPQRGLALPEVELFQGYIVNISSLWAIPTIGVQGPRERGNPNWNAAADMTWLRGNHNMKAGFQMLQISRLQTNRFGEIIINNNEVTRDPQRASSTGDPLASALLGLPTQIRAYVPELGSIDFHTSTLSGYFQDQWAMKPNLTLNYGVRYDYVTRVIGDGLQSGPDFDTGEWLIALEQLPEVCAANVPPPCLPRPVSQIPNGQYIRATGERNSMLKPIKDNIGPRVGLAWQIDPATVLRTGYGLMWDSMVSRSQYGQHQFETWGWPQVSGFDTATINTESGKLERVEDFSSLPYGKPRPEPWTSTGYFNDPDRKNAYSHQWHVELQREFNRDLVAGVAYVGSYNGRMEYSGRAAAAKVPGVDPVTGRRLTAAEVNQLRPWPHITGTFRYSDDIGMSKYNSVQFKLQQRYSDLTNMVSYTFSRTIDTSSGWFDAEGGIGGGATVQNYWDIDANRATSSYDIPHILTWASVWNLPFGRGKRWMNQGLASWILGNWEVNWFLLARSGQPFTPTVGGDPANIGVSGTARPNLVGDPELSDPTAAQWFNVAAFAVPNNEFGNAKRNSLRAPAFWNVDLGLQKNVSLGNGMRLGLRLDAFNMFNNINLGNPETRIDLPTAGRITGMNGRPRQLQLGLRLNF
ncbi:MAG TPA: TonB-dependent receptor [Vicinamibacterales bacterium]|nr:TonB-dependent receptor [Vicinamibacterales bacterium]